MSKLSLIRSESIYSNPSAGVEVYSGFIQPKGVPVAIKEQLHPDVASANSSISEALGQAKLDHPNILKIYECFLESQPKFIKSVIVVELMDHDLIKEIDIRKYYGQYWPESDLLTHMRSLISALSYAQSKEISHRDIKPQNIFVTETFLKIGDFGSMAQNVSQRNVGTIVGSPLFFSPELKGAYVRALCGEITQANYDPYRSDVYSLGVTLVLMATLEPPVALLKTETLENSTAQVLASLGTYPTLQQWVARMLTISNMDRPCFEMLERWENEIAGVVQSTQEPVAVQSGYSYSGEGSQTYGSMTNAQGYVATQQDSHVQPDICNVCGTAFIPSRSQPSDVCSQNCGQLRASAASFTRKCKVCTNSFTDTSWAHSLPSSLSVFSQIASDFCSLLCLRHFSQASQDFKPVCLRCPTTTGVKRLQCSHSYCENHLKEMVFVRQSLCWGCEEAKNRPGNAAGTNLKAK